MNCLWFFSIRYTLEYSRTKSSSGLECQPLVECWLGTYFGHAGTNTLPPKHAKV